VTWRIFESTPSKACCPQDPNGHVLRLVGKAYAAGNGACTTATAAASAHAATSSGSARASAACRSHVQEAPAGPPFPPRVISATSISPAGTTDHEHHHRPNQWQTRPDDQRYPSFEELAAAVSTPAISPARRTAAWIR
jgi:hypothetical protein